MIENENRERIKSLIEELLTHEVTDEREIEINLEMDKLSPDSYWSDYIFWSDDYLDENENFLMEKFLDKIFSYQPIIMGYTPIKDKEN